MPYSSAYAPTPSLAKEGNHFHTFWVPVKRRERATALKVLPIRADSSHN
jgi:hypothetical protein